MRDEAIVKQVTFHMFAAPETAFKRTRKYSLKSQRKGKQDAKVTIIFD
jgi:hypothetical protein